MVKAFKKSACFLTVLSLLFSFSFGAGSSYAMEKEQKSKAVSTVLSNSQVMTEEESYELNIDWGFDEEDYMYSEEEDLEEDGFGYIVNDRNEAVITYYYDTEYNEETDDFEIVGDKHLVIPNTLGGYPVTMIYDYSFSMLEATESITIPEGVKVIGEGAFSACDGLKTINIPDTVTAIDSIAFYANEDLEKIVIPNSVVEFGIGIFASDYNLTDVTLPSNISEIPDAIFSDCISLEKIDIPDSVVKIKSSSFASTGFTEFTVPDTVNTIGDYAFSYCEKLEKVTIPASVTKIGEDIFYECTKDVVIYGEKGSYAETYANENKIPFKAINEDPVVDPDEKVIATGITTNGLNVRRSATTKADNKIGYLTEGTKIEIVEKVSSNWYKIKYNGSYGYVSGKYVQLDEQSEVIATGVTTNGLNVRSSATTKADNKIGYLTKGTKVEIVEKVSSNWYKIKYDGSYGYVSGKYLQLDEQSEVIATGVTTNGLNVRSSATTKEDNKIGYLTKGTKVEIVEIVSSSWYKIKYNGSYGYVSGKYLQLDGQSEVIATGTTTAGLNVRKGPSTGYSKIGYLGIGTKIEIVEKLSNGWYKIKYNGEYGYVSGDYVKLS